MRPREFVSRIIDLFEFTEPSGLTVKPETFTSASWMIRANRPTRKRVDSYVFTLLAEEALDHTIIKASMGDGVHILSGTICFTIQEYDISSSSQWIPSEDHFMESWQIPTFYSDDATMQEIVTMLTILKLKTNHHIEMKTKK
jgi:hypothetical protein